MGYYTLPVAMTQTGQSIYFYPASLALLHHLYLTFLAAAHFIGGIITVITKAVGKLENISRTVRHTVLNTWGGN